MEAQFALTEAALQSVDKLAAKDPSEHRDGKKEARACWNPMGVIELQSAGGHDAMRVRVMFELLIPGVEHTEEADLRAERLRIASDFEEGCGTGLQQIFRSSQSRQTDGSNRKTSRGQAAVETHPGIPECWGDGERTGQPKRGRHSPRRPNHSPYTKGNFEFERVVKGWRGSHSVLDLRLKG